MKKYFLIIAVLVGFAFSAQAAEKPANTVPALEQIAENANAIILAGNNAILYDAFGENGSISSVALQESICTGSPPGPRCYCEVTMHFSSSYPFYWETAAWRCPGAQGEW